MIQRPEHLARLKALLGFFTVVAIVGARQVGKTTLAAQLAADYPEPVTTFDLESPEDRQRLAEPMVALERWKGLVVIDEVQHHPELFQVLRVLADRPKTPARFLVLGSASPKLLQQSSESLAGRIAYHELPGLDLREVGPGQLHPLWLRGGFPRSFVAPGDEASWSWRAEMVRTYLERDLARLDVQLPAETMRRFWTMLAHSHAQLWNASEIGRSLGLSDKTVTRYLDALTSTFMARRLAPWFENIGKRHVKAPKVYLSDPGLLHTLLGIHDEGALLGHPKAGASWEGFALEQVIRRLRAERHECFFWRTYSGAELDLFIVSGQRRIGFEFKLTDAPGITSSMRSALKELRLQQLDVVHAGKHTFPLADNVRAVALANILDDIEPLRSGQFD